MTSIAYSAIVLSKANVELDKGIDALIDIELKTSQLERKMEIIVSHVKPKSRK